MFFSALQWLEELLVTIHQWKELLWGFQMWKRSRSHCSSSTMLCRSEVFSQQHVKFYREYLLYCMLWMLHAAKLIICALFYFLNTHPRICLLIFTGRERKGGGWERERLHVGEKHQSFASHLCLDLGSNLQPRYVPWLGTEPITFGVQDNTPTNWATWPGLFVLPWYSYPARFPKSKWYPSLICVPIFLNCLMGL